MKIEWHISDEDVKKVTDFINQQSGTYVTSRISQNIEYQNVLLNRNTVIKSLLYSLLTPILKQETNSKIASLLQIKPSPLQYGLVLNNPDIKLYVFNLLKHHGIIQDINKIPDYFATNFNLLEESNWDLLQVLEKAIYKKDDKQAERSIADEIDTMFKGFGAIEARIFLLYLGLTKYEIPIDAVVSEWFNNFGFPLKLSTIALQDRNYYHFISNGIQLLCERANVFPCVLEAAIHSGNIE